MYVTLTKSYACNPQTLRNSNISRQKYAETCVGKRTLNFKRSATAAKSSIQHETQTALRFLTVYNTSSITAFLTAQLFNKNIFLS